MESFTRISGVSASILRPNIDTDQIIPSTELLRVRTEGYAPALFKNWRNLPDGTPNPDFILNKEPWKHAVILLAGRNFGCGSSREAAPRALREYGFRSVIAPSFGGIFFGNSFRNGLLPVELPDDAVALLDREVSERGGAELSVDLERQVVTSPAGREFAFATPMRLRHMLLNGVDEISATLSNSDAIAGFRAGDRRKRPWAYEEPGR
jgi:3-isopropylmalate/(R)-2-methylmalate dehydratase small subunit